MLGHKSFSPNSFLDSGGNNLLHFVCRFAAYPLELIQVLVENGVDVNKRNNDNKTPFDISTDNGVRAYLFNCMDKDYLNDNQKFFLGCELGFLEKVQVFIENNKDLIMCIDQNGFYPLAVAANNGKTSIVKCLLDCGASRQAAKGIRAFDFVFEHLPGVFLFPSGELYFKMTDLISCLELLSETEEDEQKIELLKQRVKFFCAIAQDDVKKVESIIKKVGLLVFNFIYNDKEIRAMPLHMAAKYNHYKIAKVLIKYGCPVNQLNAYGQTPLCYVGENYKMAKLFIDNEVDVASLDTFGKTALFHIVEHCKEESKDLSSLVKRLLENGLLLYPQDYAYGDTIFHFIVRNKLDFVYFFIALISSMLEKNGQESSNSILTLKNKDGFTIFDFIRRNKEDVPLIFGALLNMFKKLQSMEN